MTRPSAGREVFEQRRDERLRVAGFDELGRVDDDPVRPGEHLGLADVAFSREVSLDLGRRAVGGDDIAVQRRVALACLEGCGRGSGDTELDDRAVGLVQQPARGAGLVDDAHDALGARFVLGVGAVIGVEGVDVVGTQQLVARGRERNGLLLGFGGLARRGRGRSGCRRRSSRVGRPGHGPGASGKEQNGCRGEQHEAEGRGSGGVERARHVTNLTNRAG